MRAAALAGALALALALAASAPGAATTRPPAGDLPSTSFGGGLPAGHTAYSNESLADLFVALTHDLEWGGHRPNLVRYEAPVRVGLAGHGAERYRDFLDGYLAELRIRAGVPITLGAAPHNLLVSFVPDAAFRASVPRHFCVVVPGAPDWAEFARAPARFGKRPFETETAIAAMTVFIPDRAAPYLARACLVEEIAQALGPADDLYGLGPSIFNDDAAHLWPTRLDFLMLQVLYAPELHTGLNRAETRTAARAALTRLNPEGRHAPPLALPRDREMADWVEALRAAFDRGRPAARRLASARRALAIAAGRAPLSVYHCHSLVALARASGDDPGDALAALRQAERVCATAHGPDDIRIAQIRLDRARLEYRLGDPGAAMRLTDGLEAIFAALGQDERLAALYDLRAAALQAIQPSASVEARRGALAWHAYAIGTATSAHWVGN